MGVLDVDERERGDRKGGNWKIIMLMISFEGRMSKG